MALPRPAGVRTTHEPFDSDSSGAAFGMTEAAERDETATEISARRFRRGLVSVLTAGVLALAVMATLASWLMLRAQDFNRWIDHTYLVEAHINSFDAVIERAETARRGYLLSPTPLYRQTYEGFRTEIPDRLNRIAVDTLDNPIQRQAVAELRAVTGERERRISAMMTFASSGDVDGAVDAFKKDRDHPLLTRIRALTAGMLREEDRLLKLRLQREVDNASELFAVVLIGGGLLMLLSLGGAALMRRYASDLDQAQRALRRLNQELERRVQGRTLELSRANDEIQRFAYIVSHDLRSPLVNVMGFTTELELSLKTFKKFTDDLAERAPEQLTSEVKDAVQIDMPEAIGFIRSSTRKMDGLINAILRLSREGRRNLSPEPLAMTALVEGLFDSVRHRLTEKGATISIEGYLPNLVGDRLATEQIFGNLIDNAVKYLQPGRPGVIIVRGRMDGEMVHYEVQDNGRGIAAKDAERVFELFRRSGAQDQAGEGIGLAHVRALMYRLGGVITCNSELDQGSTFHLSLPSTLKTAPSS